MLSFHLKVSLKSNGILYDLQRSKNSKNNNTSVVRIDNVFLKTFLVVFGRAIFSLKKLKSFISLGTIAPSAQNKARLFIAIGSPIHFNIDNSFHKIVLLIESVRDIHTRVKQANTITAYYSFTRCQNVSLYT